MDPLIEALEYSSEEAFKKLISVIQTQMNLGKLEKYIDKTWKKERREGWNGEYISFQERKMYRFDGAYAYASNGEPNFEGTWNIVREETQRKNKKLLYSQYQMLYQEPGVYSKIELQIECTPGPKINLVFDWQDKPDAQKEHSRLIKSTVESGIISAFEDLSPAPGKYLLRVLKLQYRPFDSSFSLLHYTANRAVKRAFFVEHEEENPSIEKGRLTRAFRPNQLLSKFDLST